MAAIMFGIVFKRARAVWRFLVVVKSVFGEYLEGTKAELAGMESKQREGAEFENGLTASR
jgi:hypothetical protein